MIERELYSKNTPSQEKYVPSPDNIELFLIIEKQGLFNPTKWRFVLCHEFPIYFFSDSVVTKAEAIHLRRSVRTAMLCQTSQAHYPLTQQWSVPLSS